MSEVPTNTATDYVALHRGVQAVALIAALMTGVVAQGVHAVANSVRQCAHVATALEARGILLQAHTSDRSSTSLHPLSTADTTSPLAAKTLPLSGERSDLIL